MDPNDKDAMWFLAMNSDSENKVAELFGRLKVLLPENWSTYYEYGVRLFEFRKYNEAKAAFERSRELADGINPGKISEWIAKCFEMIGDNEAARAEYSRAKYENPKLQSEN